MQKVICFLVIGLFSMVKICSTAELSEPRKNSRPLSNSPPSANSLTSSQDGSPKSQQLQQPPQTQTFLRQTAPDLGSTNANQAQSTVYTHIQAGQQPTTPQGYFLSVNAQQGALAPGPTPVLMSYLPQTQPTNGIQYLQLIPTRPLIVPISPYISQLQGYGGNPGQSTTSHVSATSPSQYAPASAYTQPAQPYSHGPFSPTIQQSRVGAYTNPIVSYFRPHSGIQLVSGPADMSLNTNEYLPIQGDSSYKTRRP